MFGTYCRSAVIISTLSYQYCYYSYYHKIHLRRYICCCCLLTYYNSITFIIFYYKLSQNLAFLKNVEPVHLWYFRTKQFYCRQRNVLPLIFDHQQQVQKPSPVIKPSGHWKTEHYQGLRDHFKGDVYSYINFLAWGILQKYTTVPRQCEGLTWNWMWCLLYFDLWSHFDERPGSV